MTAAETIAAAIEKLEGLDSRRYIVEGDWLIEIEDGFYERTGQDPRRPLTNDPAIVTLHRTIDAQIVILKSALIRTVPRFGEYVFAAEALQLARAILGEVSS